MRNTKKLWVILFIVCFTGCQNFIDSISGTSTTNNRNAQYLTKAEQIQNIYWSCVESPSTIDQNISIWKEEFGPEIVDKAFYHYNHRNETIKLIPESFTLEDSIGKIKNQRDTNSCSAFAASYMMNILVSKTLQENKDYEIDPYFIYYLARKNNRIKLSLDNGVHIKYVLDTLKEYGVWSSNMYVDSKMIPIDYDKKLSFKLKDYRAITDRSQGLINELQKILAIEQLPILIQIAINKSNFDSYNGITKNMILDFTNYHALCIIGYETRERIVYFKAANSWGTSWGDDGFLWIHQDWFFNKELIPAIWIPVKDYY